MDRFLEEHEPATETKEKLLEPRAVTKDVADILRKLVKPSDDEDVERISVSLIAEKADTSTRTVYRVISESTFSINLDLADRLCLAADSHLSCCRLAWPTGVVTDYQAPNPGNNGAGGRRI